MSRVIAYVVSNPGSNDARVIKMAKCAADNGFDVHLFGVLKPGFDSYENVDNITFYRYDWKPIIMLLNNYLFFKILYKINKRFSKKVAVMLLPFMKYSLFSSIFSEEIASINPDIIHSHDLICLPAAKRAAILCDAKLIYDAHELEIHRNPPLPWMQKQFVKITERYNSRHARQIITVGRFVAKEIKRTTKHDNIEILYNSPIINKTTYSLRRDLGSDSNKKIILYVGKVAVGRGIEQIINILPNLPSDLIFATVGPSDPKQRERLLNLAERGKVSSRFFILPPVPYDQVVNYISEADLGIISVQPVTLSYRYCMPNKLFEMSFANVPIISNELDEINEFIDEHKNGITMDINNNALLTHYIIKTIKNKNQYMMPRRKLMTLSSNYSWEAQEKKLLNIYDSICPSIKSSETNK